MRMMAADTLIKAMLDDGVFKRLQDFTHVCGETIVDAEPVTRCKDCFWSMRASLTGADLGYDCTLLKLRRLSPEFFCADGMPKQPDELDKFEQAIQHLRELWAERCLNTRGGTTDEH